MVTSAGNYADQHYMDHYKDHNGMISTSLIKF